jgi:hypothetical protein
VSSRPYEEPVKDTFDEVCHDARSRGRLAVLALVARELTDLASASIAARRHQPFNR